MFVQILISAATVLTIATWFFYYGMKIQRDFYQEAKLMAREAVLSHQNAVQKNYNLSRNERYWNAFCSTEYTIDPIVSQPADPIRHQGIPHQTEFQKRLEQNGRATLHIGKHAH